MQQWKNVVRLEAGAELAFRERKEDKCRALMRIVEAVAIATTHTYTSEVYTAFLTEFGVVEEGSHAIGCDRTGAMNDFLYDR